MKKSAQPKRSESHATFQVLKKVRTKTIITKTKPAESEEQDRKVKGAFVTLVPSQNAFKKTPIPIIAILFIHV